MTSHDNEGGWRRRLEQSVDDLDNLSKQFVTLEPRILHASKFVSDELRRTESKESEIGGRFRSQVDDYKHAQNELQRLENAHTEHTENNRDLADDFEVISEKLDNLKKKVDEKASGMTDAKPLIDIRAAIQRLRAENKEMDIRIGILDYDLSQRRRFAANPQEHSPRVGEESDEDHSFDSNEV